VQSFSHSHFGSNHHRLLSRSFESKEDPFLLPEAGQNEGLADGRKPTLSVNGAPVRFDALGPIIITREGLLGSIENWHELSEADQALALRKISKRNQARLAALKEEKNRREAAE
jgi:hypothetical protein